MVTRRLPFPASPLSVWATEPDSIQLTWGARPAGEIGVSIRHANDASLLASAAIDHHGGPGSATVTDLPSATPFVVEFSTAGGTRRVQGHTLAAPPGELLTKVATISDLHLGSDHFGFFKRMRHTNSDDPVPFAFRSAHTAITEAIGWGASHLIIKGDAAHHGHAEHFAAVGRLVDAFPELEISLIPGNHDVDLKGGASLPETVGTRAVHFERHVHHVDLDGIRLVIGNSTLEGEGPGSLAAIGGDLIDRVRTAGRPALIAVHQQLQEHDTIRYWPPGIRGSEANAFLDELAAASANVIVTTGHTHRNRMRQHGTVTITEVGSTHHWPGVWAGYAVHEGGIRQVVRRIGTPDLLSWHEYSKNAVLGVWGRYAPGTIGQRCFSRSWT